MRFVLLLPLLMGATLSSPEGWTAADDKALADAAAASSHFGATSVLGTKIAAMRITPAGDTGVSLVATRIEMHVPNDPAAVRAELDAFHGSAQRSQLAGTQIVEQGWSEKLDDVAKLVEANLAFHDTTNKLTVTSRLLVAATADSLVAVSGECLARDDADAKALGLCKIALTTLDPGANRVAITVAPSGTPPPPHEVHGPLVNGPSMSESHVPLPPISISTETRQEPDRRPVFIGAGIVLLAVVFWWNMKRKSALEDQEDHD